MSFDTSVSVTAVSEGEDVYDAHAAGIERVAGAARDGSRDVEMFGGKVTGARSALMGMHLSILAVEQGMRLFGIQNHALTQALDAMVVGLTIARTALAVYRTVQESVTLQNWARAASEVAASAWFAPVVLGIIIAAVGALLAYETGILKFGTGGSVLLTKPTLMLGGERGPEVAIFTPLGAGGGAGPSGWTIGEVHVTVISPDPEVAGRSVTDALLKLKQAGR